MSLPILFTRPRKKNPKAVIFEMFEPTPDVMCPITQEPIATSQLEFFKDRVMSQDKPNHTGTRLACNHEFTAMCLLYHWARNGNVLCPVCRSGPKGARLNLRGIPEHFTADMMRRIKNERENDREERNRENEEAARQSDNGRWFVTFLQSNHCYCMVNTPDMCGMIVPMDALLENNMCVFTGRVAGDQTLGGTAVDLGDGPFSGGQRAGLDPARGCEVVADFNAHSLPLALVVDEQERRAVTGGAQKLLLGGLGVGPPAGVALDKGDVTCGALGHGGILREPHGGRATAPARRLHPW